MLFLTRCARPFNDLGLGRLQPLALTIHQAIADVAFRLRVEQPEPAQLASVAANEVLALRGGVYRQRLADFAPLADDLCVVIARKRVRRRDARFILV